MFTNISPEEASVNNKKNLGTAYLLSFNIEPALNMLGLQLLKYQIYLTVREQNLNWK